jgi:hypothetical protein
MPAKFAKEFQFLYLLRQIFVATSGTCGKVWWLNHL